jgi:hypothetical protein
VFIYSVLRKQIVMNQYGDMIPRTSRSAANGINSLTQTDTVMDYEVALGATRLRDTVGAKVRGAWGLQIALGRVAKAFWASGEECGAKHTIMRCVLGI